MTVLHVRHLFCAMYWRSLPNDDVGEIFIFEVLTTTRARRSKCFILSLYIETIHVKQATVHFAYFVQRNQHEMNEKDLTWHNVSVYCDVFVAAAVTASYSLLIKPNARQ